MKELVELLIKEKWLNLSSSDAEVKLVLWNYNGKAPSEDEVNEVWAILDGMKC